ncbi:MAG TPA: hypothetical protein VEH04_02505 [Verrucomicrobiae bacterium]|nr:hypothetical protein [Verrucomicrobiae bacterium]
MIEPRLHRLLSGLERVHRRTRLRWLLMAWWGCIAVVIPVLRLTLPAVEPMRVTAFVLIAGLLGTWVIRLWERRRKDDFELLVLRLEREHPELRPLLSTALEQKPDPQSGEWNFLQTRVVREVLRHPKQRQVQRRLESQSRWANFGNLAALGVVIAIAWFTPAAAEKTATHRLRFIESVAVEPGDVEVEKGSSIVVTIEFERNPPAGATLVIKGEAAEKKIPLERHLADPVFGTSLREINESATYQIEYGEKSTREYSIKVFEFPALVRADAELSFPQYTGQTNKSIPDTLRISAVEGSRLDYALQLNKPVSEARLVSKDSTIPLNIGSNGIVTLDAFVLTNSAKFSLHLRDAEGRTNRRSAEFVFQALPNRSPELKLTFPRGDQRISRLQELRLEGEVADDFGLLKYGIGYGVAGDEPRLFELGAGAAANEKRPLQQLIDVEKLGVEVDQVLSYFVWADDYGPGGEPRRTYSDMFFAEVRPFEEIFRPDQSGGGEEQGQQGQEGGGGGGQATRLTELQKQIVIATWKMQREKGGASGALAQP